MTRNRYENELNSRVTIGERIPAWFFLDFVVSTIDDTPVDVSGHEFALTLALDSNPATNFSLTADMTQAAAGHVEWELDTTVAEAEPGVWNWNVVWVQGNTPLTDPIEISFGGQVTMQASPTEVPA
jgi:hypothetical protein